jgi:predicted DCC family thiol-disulfide oxidoreductase YuxK
MPLMVYATTKSQAEACTASEPNLIVLFDGLCNLCCAAVDFIIAHDRRERIHFCPLQSEAAHQLLAKGQPYQGSTGAIVFIENGRSCSGSTAWFLIAKYLDGWWPLLYVLLAVPRRIRDLAYNLIANNRYKWFGKRDTCRVPTEDTRRRFLG